jgi:hypothetical protein
MSVEISKHFLKLGWPYNYPFLPFADWTDLNCYRGRFELLHHPAFFSTSPSAGIVFTYPAPLAVLFSVFFHLKWHVISVFLGVTFGLLFLWAGLLGRGMVRLGIHPFRVFLFLASTILLSYPLGFEFSLAQVEICLLLISIAGVVALLRGHTYLAAVLFGIGASTKYYPGIYLALFLARKEYRQFAVGILTGVVVTLLSLWYVGPTIAIAYRGAKAGAGFYHDHYMSSFLPETSYDHSILGFIKFVARRIGHDVLPSHFITAYLVFVVVAGLALFFLWIRRLPFLNQVLSLCILSVLLMPTSHDYTLIQLYLPWGLLVLYTLRRAKEGRSVRDPIAAFVCFGFLFAGESEVILHGRSLTGQMKMIALAILLVIALTKRWETPSVDGKNAELSLTESDALGYTV